MRRRRQAREGHRDFADEAAEQSAGPSPDGKTWSYALGDWQDEGWLKAKAQGAPNRGGGGAHMT